MGIILELEESHFAGYIEDGMSYKASVVDVKLREKPFKDNRTGENVKKIEFKFKLQANDGHDGQDIWGETSTIFTDNPECRLKNWAEALLGQRLPPGYRLDTDSLVDRECFVDIAKKDYERNGETKYRNYVREVRPTRENALALAHSDEPF